MKNISRKNIFKKANVLFIATILVFTTIFVFTPMTKVAKADPMVISSYGFEDWTAAFPPPGWSIYNVNTGNTWVQSTTGQRTGVACVKCTYDYTVQPNDDWITTKGTVVAPGGVFSLWVDTYSYGDDEYEIYMSTTGNTPDDFLAGTLLAGVYDPVPTVYTQYTFDMSTYVGQTVYFSVRYTATYAWYIWVDDITFPDGITEGFENTASYFPGWTNYVVGGTSTINKFVGVQSGIYPTCVPHSGSWMAQYPSYNIPSGNSARLIHDAPFDFSITGLDVFTLSFWMFHDTGYSSSSDRVSAQVSLDGSTWMTLATINRYDGSTGWKQHTVDLSAYAAESAVYIGVLGVSEYGNNMYIDDVEITGNNPVNDYEMTSINSPVTGPAGTVIPEVTVTNLDSDSEPSIPVTLTIEKKLPGGGTVLEYNQTVAVDFDSYEIKVITFPEWTPADWQLAENVDIEYLVCACVESPGDSNSINDCKCESFTLHYPYLHDVGVIEIISPTTGPVQTYPVEVTVKNFGTYAETDVPVEVVIEKDGVPEYDDTAVVPNINPGESINVTFPSWTASEPGEYQVTACTQLSVDTNPGNDCLTETVYSTANNLPVAGLDPVYNVLWGSTTTFDVLANDYDPDGDPIYIDSITSTPLYGVATIVPGGIQYTHTVDTVNVQAESFYYQISDGSLTTTASVSILITGLELVSLEIDPADSNAIKAEIRNHYTFPLDGITRVWLLWQFTIDPPAPEAYLTTPPGPGVPNIYGLDDLLPYASNNLLPICTYYEQTVTQNCTVEGDACFTLKLSVPAPIDEEPENFLYCDKIVTGCVSESGLYLLSDV